MTISSPIPLYHRVSTILRQRVSDGTYPAGSQLAPEDELAAEFSVSRATIRQAVGALVTQGLLSRRQGRGTFVLPNARDSLGQGFNGSLAELLSEVRRAKIRDVSIEHEAPIPPRIAEQLQLSDERGTIVRRTREFDGETFAYTINYLPRERGKGLTKRELTSGSLMDTLEKRGHGIYSARQTIRAQLADVAQSEALSQPLGAALLFVERLSLAKDETPIQFVQSWYRADSYAYTVTLDRSAGDPRDQFA